MDRLYDPAWVDAPLSNRRWPDASYRTVRLLEPDDNGVLHSTFLIEGYDLCDRIDSYALVGEGEALFVDTGFWEVCGTEHLDALMQQNHLRWDDAAAFLTHFHDDHVGNVEYLEHKGVTRVFHAPRAAFLERLCDFVHSSGWMHALVQAGSAPTPEGLAAEIGRVMWDNDVLPGFERMQTRDGQRLHVAGREWTAMHAPGHSPCHQVLVDEGRRMAFTGDHLHDFGPGIMQFDLGRSLVDEYLASLDRLQALRLNAVYPAHQDPIRGEEEVSALIESTRALLERSLSKRIAVLQEFGPLSAWGMARRVSKDDETGLPRFDSLNVRAQARAIATQAALLESLAWRGDADRQTLEDGTVEYQA